MHTLGISDDDPNKAVCRKSLDRLLHDRGHEVYCQPCLSPTWDTSIALHAVMEAGGGLAGAAEDLADVKVALDWLASKQISAPGDWRKRAPGLVSGGWAFQFNNPHYPDLDDTAMVAAALDRANKAPGAYDPGRDADLSARIAGSSACRVRPAVSPPMIKTTTRNTSTASPSPTTAPCSTRTAST
jgi:squalene-hopene/tetraprenyl-beta-curcumene cyclase